MPPSPEKHRVALLFGGMSGEHEVSLRSARSVFEAMDRKRFEPIPIGIDPEGNWHQFEDTAFRELTDLPQARVPTNSGHRVALLPIPGRGRELLRLDDGAAGGRIDSVFSVLHGTFGEDGAMQGLLELAGIPYVGPGVLGSAVGMDKDVQKRLLAAAGLPVVPFRTLRREEVDSPEAAAVMEAVDVLGLPLFVKPANLGSSVGITRVAERSELAAALELGFRFDTKLVLERGVKAREIECAVLGNETPEASVCGEIAPCDGFYSYEAKYLDEKGAELLVPAPLSEPQAARLRALAVQTYRTLEGRGLARVDFFLERDNGEIFINEVNTLPGFTSISMYPRLWEASGLAYPDLITRLIELGEARQARQAALSRSYDEGVASTAAAARSPSR